MSRPRKSVSARINELPDNLLEKILTYVPIQDAVKTSVLSRRWRSIWKKIPKLKFDDSFCKAAIKRLKRKPIEVICQVLLLHVGPIQNFSLMSSYIQSCAEIDQFLLVVSKWGIKELTLEFSKGENYRLPSSIFSCQQLEDLSIYSCSFRPPAGFKGFSKLVSLRLEDVQIDGRIFSSLIQNCPLLEILTFDNSTIYNRLVLFAPNLKYFTFIGLCKFLCFSNTPILESVELYEEMDIAKGRGNDKCLLSGSLPRLDNLDLEGAYIQYMTHNHALELLVAFLCNLKRLGLCYVCFQTSADVSSIVTLIGNSPKLEKLVIHAHLDDTKPDSVTIEGWDFTLYQLEEVELGQISGLKCELQFIELLLANSPRLKKFNLHLNFENGLDKGLHFFKELSRFRRSSPLLELFYTVGDE